MGYDKSLRIDPYKDQNEDNTIKGAFRSVTNAFREKTPEELEEQEAIKQKKLEDKVNKKREEDKAKEQAKLDEEAEDLHNKPQTKAGRKKGVSVEETTIVTDLKATAKWLNVQMGKHEDDKLLTQYYDRAREATLGAVRELMSHQEEKSKL